MSHDALFQLGMGSGPLNTSQTEDTARIMAALSLSARIVLDLFRGAFQKAGWGVAGTLAGKAASPPL